MTALTLIDEAPVRVVIRRKAGAGSAGDAGRAEAAGTSERYGTFQRKVTEAASRAPGFLAREVLQPSADQPDWIVQLRFASLETARAWLASPERAALYAEGAAGFDEFGGFGDEGEPRIYREEPDEPDSAVSAVISSTVAPGDEDAFLAWQARISDAETRFRGFRGHRVQRPVEGVQKEWVIVLSFDTERDLEAWTGSAERAALLAEGARFNADLELRKARFGFGFWRLDRETHEIPVIKNNLLVLLVLYPTVYLWGFFVSAPLLENHDVPFWLTLFVGNLVSTQLLGWVLVPWIFQRFRWWLAASPGWKANVFGFALLVVLYGASMAVYAWLLSWP